MRFELVQRIDAPVEAVAAALRDPEFHQSLTGLPKIGAPELVGVEDDGTATTLRVRYRYVGDLPAGASTFVHKDRLTWIEESVHPDGEGEVRFRLLPDHYADRMSCSGRYTLEPTASGGTIRRVHGDLRVKVLLVGGTVERALIEGLEEHLEAEAPAVAAWVAARS